MMAAVLIMFVNYWKDTMSRDTAAHRVSSGRRSTAMVVLLGQMAAQSN